MAYTKALRNLLSSLDTWYNGYATTSKSKKDGRKNKYFEHIALVSSIILKGKREISQSKD